MTETQMKASSPGPAVRIKKYCEASEGTSVLANVAKVTVREMRLFMEACKADDAAANLPAGTTLAKMAEGIPEG